MTAACNISPPAARPLPQAPHRARHRRCTRSHRAHFGRTVTGGRGARDRFPIRYDLHPHGSSGERDCSSCFTVGVVLSDDGAAGVHPSPTGRGAGGEDRGRSMPRQMRRCARPSLTPTPLPQGEGLYGRHAAREWKAESRDFGRYPAKMGSEWVFPFLTRFAPPHRKTHSDPIFARNQEQVRTGREAGPVRGRRAGNHCTDGGFSPRGRRRPRTGGRCGPARSRSRRGSRASVGRRGGRSPARRGHAR